MGTDFSPADLIGFIQGDFEAAWNSLAGNPAPGNRCNFMFALQAMILLEVACRLCKSDPKREALLAFSDKLHQREPGYFERLPSPCLGESDEFALPNFGPDPDNQLLAAIFDLIRNGQAHQYQQIRVTLKDGVDFQVSLTGAQHGAYLNCTLAHGRPAEHLGLVPDPSGGLLLMVRTDVLYLDLRDSIRDANLLGRDLTLAYLQRPRKSARLYQKRPPKSASFYQFTSTDLQAALSRHLITVLRCWTSTSGA